MPFLDLDSCPSFIYDLCSTVQFKFVDGEYKSITEFVADVRVLLENCYRYNGMKHWVSKQAQTLESTMQQKLALLPR